MTEEEADTLRVGNHIFAIYNLTIVDVKFYNIHDLRIQKVDFVSRHGSHTTIRDHEKEYKVYNECLHIGYESATQMIEIILERLADDLTKSHKGEIDRLDTFAETVRKDIYRSTRERLAGEQS